MSKQTAELLKAFEALPEEEKRLFTVEFMRLAVPFDSGPSDDLETALAAGRLLGDLEAEENATGSQLGVAFRSRNNREG
jgi:hypothetical protein